MPTYDYLCDACSHKFEEFQGINDKLLTKCPQCGKKKLRRLFGGGAGLIFKGSGFYQTDYRSDAYKSSAQADQNSAQAAAEKSAGNGKAATPAPAAPAAPASAPKSEGSSGKKAK